MSALRSSRLTPRRLIGSVAVASAMLVTTANAQFLWDGIADAPGTTTTSVYTDAIGWVGDIAPPNDGTADVRINDFSQSGTDIDLGSDQYVQLFDFGDSANNVVRRLTGVGLTLRIATDLNPSTEHFRNRSNDGDEVVYEPNIVLDAGVPGSYEFYVSEEQNSSGGAVFEGSITQQPGQSWTVRFDKSSARGRMVLRNPGNVVDAWRSTDGDIVFDGLGTSGGADLIVNGGAFSFIGADFFANPVTNPLTMNGNYLVGGGDLRYEGVFTHNSGELTVDVNIPDVYYFDPAVGSTLGGNMRTEAGNLAVPSEADLLPGNLEFGLNEGVLVLGGAMATDVMTKADFFANREWNGASVPTGAPRTYSFNFSTTTNNGERFGGGWAARGGSLTIDNGDGGMDATTLNRNFTVGSIGSVDGTPYAGDPVIINLDIDFLDHGNDSQFYRIISTFGQTQEGFSWTLDTNVHELGGVLSGGGTTVFNGGRNSLWFRGEGGVLRVSNPNNTYEGAIVVGTSRNDIGPLNFPGRPGVDTGPFVMVASSEGALGNANNQIWIPSNANVLTGHLFLMEDLDGGGEMFSRTINIVDNREGWSGFGSYQGDVTYTGDVILTGNENDFVLHVDSGTLTIPTFNLANNRGTTNDLNKSGPGTVIIDAMNLTGDDIDLDIQNGTLAMGDSAFLATLGNNDIEVQDGATFLLAGGAILNDTNVLSIQTNGTIGGDGTYGFARNYGDTRSVEPGVNGVGTVTFQGDWTFNPTTFLNIELDGGSSDLMRVEAGSENGDLDVSGAELTLTELAGGLPPGTVYTIVEYAGTLTGTFAAINNLTTEPGLTIDYGSGTNDVITITVPGMAMGPDLALTAGGGADVRVGDDLSFTLNLANNGVDPSNGTEVTFTLPAGTSLDTVASSVTAGTLSEAAGVVTWDVGVLGVSNMESATIVLNTSGVSRTDVTFTATTTDTDSNLGNNTDTLTDVLVSYVADFDLDGDVDMADYMVVGNAFGTVSTDAEYDANADLDSDLDVDLDDFGAFNVDFGQSI